MRTEGDIKRRKRLAHDNQRTLNSIFTSKYVSQAEKLKILIAYIESVFLHISRKHLTGTLRIPPTHFTEDSSENLSTETSPIYIYLT